MHDPAHPLTWDDAVQHRPSNAGQPAPRRRDPRAGGAPVTVAALPSAHPLVIPTRPDLATLYAAIYDRVSDDRKQDKRSVQRQHRKNLEACRTYGWTDRDYADNDAGASRFSKAIREDWDRLVSDLANGRVHVVILWEPSRGDRKLTDWSQFLDLCRMYGTLIYITSRDKLYDVRNNAEDWKQLAQDGVDSAAEVDKLRERVLSGVLEVAIIGEPTCKVPYGYYRVHDQRTKQLIGQFPDPDTAPIVDGIFRRVAAGVPLAAIARELNEAECPSPSAKKLLDAGSLPPSNCGWTSSSVRKVATRRVYIAEREYNGTVYTVDCKPLVSLELYWAAQRTLSDPKRNPHLKGNTKPGKVQYLLGDVAMCAKWGHPMRSINQAGVRWYKCRQGCAMVKANELDEYMTGLVAEFLTQPNLWRRAMATDDEAVSVARAEVERLNAEILKARSLLKSGVYSQDEYVDIKSGYEAQLIKAEQAANAATLPAPLRKLLTDDDRHATMLERFTAQHIATRRQIVRTILTPLVHEGVRGARKRGEPPRLVEDRVTIAWNRMGSAQ